MKKLLTFLMVTLLSALSFTAKAATATVYIDNPDGVCFYVYYGGDWEVTPLPNSGETPNVIEFDESKLKFFEFDPQGSAKIYKITVNDEAIDLAAAFTGEGYELYGIKDGDVIRVQLNRPETSGLTATFEKGAEAIASVEVNDKVVDVIENAFPVQLGDRVVLRPNKDYTIGSVTLNGTEVQYIPASGCYFFVVESETNVISVESEKKAAEGKAITINANDLSALTFYASDFYLFEGTPIEVTDGKVTITADAPYLQFRAGNDYEVLTATYTTADGETKAFAFDSWGKFYYVDAIAENVTAANIETKEKTVEKITATVWVEDATKLSYYFIRTKDRAFPFHSNNGPKFETGDNTLVINKEQSPIRLYLEFVGEPVNEVYLNDEKLDAVKLDTDNSVWGDFEIADGDVLKIYTTPGTVGINNVAADTDNRTYNLQGIEQNPAVLTPGLYIQNGKKFLKK